MRATRLVGVAAALVLAVSGCSAGTPGEDPRAEPPGEQPSGEQPSGTAEAAVEADAEAEPEPEAEMEVEPPFDLTRRSTTDPRSAWVVVNRRRALRPATFEPRLSVVEGYQVHPRVVRPLTRLLAAGRREGLDLRIMSAYRSAARQGYLYAAAVAARGRARADLTTARAGHSEHQTGLAVDLGRASTGACNVTACFATTREARWLARNAHRFGFVLRYPDGGRPMTGIAHESWHFRFVGRPLAAYLRRERIPTLEEAFGLVGAGS
ncbi:hypothetical protein GCM10023339_45830 [Alloalcanivorax gelatiniphagus]